MASGASLWAFAYAVISVFISALSRAAVELTVASAASLLFSSSTSCLPLAQKPLPPPSEPVEGEPPELDVAPLGVLVPDEPPELDELPHAAAPTINPTATTETTILRTIIACLLHPGDRATLHGQRVPVTGGSWAAAVSRS